MTIIAVDRQTAPEHVSREEARVHLCQQLDEVLTEVHAHRAANAVLAAEVELFKAKRDLTEPGQIAAAIANFEQAMQEGAVYGVPNREESIFAEFCSPYVGRRFLIDAECGVGKSTELAKWLKDNPSLNAVIVVPDHKSTADMESNFASLLGDDFAVIRGMTADSPDGAGKMCEVPELVEKLWDIGGRASDLCGKLTGDEENGEKKCCPHRGSCDYHQQNFGARVTMIAGGVSLGQLDKLKVRPDLIVLDDMSIDRLMRETAIPLIKVATFVTLQAPKEAGVSAKDLKLMQDFCVDMNTIVENASSGMMLWSNDLNTLGDAYDTMGLGSVFQCAKVDFKKFIKPGDPKPGITDVTQRFAKWNKHCDLMAELAEAVTRILYGGQASIEILRSTNDMVTLMVRRPQEIASSCKDAPVVILDATGKKAALDMFFQTDVQHSSAPWVRDFDGVKHFKVGDTLMCFRSWTPVKPESYSGSPEQLFKDAKTAENNIQWLVRFLDKLNFEYRRVGAIFPKYTVVRVKEIWDQRGYRPDGVTLTSLSTPRAVNSMDDVEALVVLSRPGIRAKNLEAMATALAGRDVERVSNFDRVAAHYRMADGTVQFTTRECHPDMEVELLRQQAVEATLRQAGARARTKRANGRDRLHLFWLQSTPTEKIEYDQIITLNTLRSWITEYDWLPSVGFLPLERMAATFGHALGNSKRAVSEACRRNPAIKPDYEWSLSRYRDSKLPGEWSEWHLFPHVGLQPFAVALQVVSLDVAAAKKLLKRLRIEFSTVEPLTTSNSTSLPLKAAQPPNKDTYSGSLCIERRSVRGSEGTPLTESNISPHDDGPLGVLFDLGIFSDLRAKGVTSLVAALIGKTPKAVERLLSRYAEVRERLQHAYKTGEGSRWAVRTGRYSVSFKLEDVGDLDEARAKLAAAGLTKEVLSTLKPLGAGKL